jgi:hypothetical protein
VQTPPPYANRPGVQTPPPYRPTPPPQGVGHPVPGRPRPGTVGRPAPTNSAGRGCGIAAIVIGVIVGALVLLGLLGALVAKNKQNDPDSNGSGPLAPVAVTSAPAGAHSTLIPGSRLLD